jgi:hypothetical protein
MQLQALDSFISPIPDFQGDVSISMVPISARTPSTKSADDSSVGPSAGSSRIQADKRKAVAIPPPPKKAKKVVAKKAGGVKINDLAPKPSLPQLLPKVLGGKFTMRRSNRYS